MTITTDVENYPGFAEIVQGPWLMEQMRAAGRPCRARGWSAIPSFRSISRAGRSSPSAIRRHLHRETLIVCTGAQARWLGLPSEELFRGFGVSACATCDGFFFRGKEVVVVGGGNTAVEEAIFLTNFATKVTLVHRRNACARRRSCRTGCSATRRSRWSGTTWSTEIVGGGEPPAVSGVRIRCARPAQERAAGEGVFVAIGHTPATRCSAANSRSTRKAISSRRRTPRRPAIPGVFAAGDVKDKVFRQAVTAAGMGCMAALEAEQFLAAQE